jgi:hypothetical protein
MWATARTTTGRVNRVVRVTQGRRPSARSNWCERRRCVLRGSLLILSWTPSVSTSSYEPGARSVQVAVQAAIQATEDEADEDSEQPAGATQGSDQPLRDHRGPPGLLILKSPGTAHRARLVGRRRPGVHVLGRLVGSAVSRAPRTADLGWPRTEGSLWLARQPISVGGRTATPTLVQNGAKHGKLEMTGCTAYGQYCALHAE